MHVSVTQPNALCLTLGAPRLQGRDVGKVVSLIDQLKNKFNQLANQGMTWEKCAY